MKWFGLPVQRLERLIGIGGLLFRGKKKISGSLRWLRIESRESLFRMVREK